MEDQSQHPPYEPTQQAPIPSYASVPSPPPSYAATPPAPPPVYPYGSDLRTSPFHRRPWFWITVVVTLVLIILTSSIVVTVASRGSGEQPAATAPSAHGSTPVSQPTSQPATGNTPANQPATSQPTSVPAQASPAPGAHSVGDVVTIDGWQVVVNSAKTSQGGQFDTLRSGDVYLEIDVSLTNQTGQTQYFSSFNSLTLKDSTGQEYNQTFVSDAPSEPNGNVSSGGKLRGTVAYEVPASMHAFEFDVQPDPFRVKADVATWNLSV